MNLFIQKTTRFRSSYSLLFSSRTTFICRQCSSTNPIKSTIW